MIEVKNQSKLSKYYDRFSKVYDFLSPKIYYHNARKEAIKELRLTKQKVVLNVPVGTGQNFEYFQQYLHNSGLIVGVDLSQGMLDRAQEKIGKNKWENICLIRHDVESLNFKVLVENTTLQDFQGFDSILCDLGLSCFPNWKEAIDNLVTLLACNGRIVIMDWYVEKPSLRRSFVNWIGKGEVSRPIWQYLETKVDDFQVKSSYNRGGVFIASGTKVQGHTTHNNNIQGVCDSAV